ncbi:MAG: hypothetical protein LBQ75_00970, partial [Zoogloeaceae bacterium]|nr:hypothetical protein [Zoogloeaceae bacterium]
MILVYGDVDRMEIVMPIRKHPLAALCLPAVILSFISLPVFAQSASGEALPEAEAQTIVEAESSSAQPSSDVTPASPARAVTPRPAPAKASSGV